MGDSEGRVIDIVSVREDVLLSLLVVLLLVESIAVIDEVASERVPDNEATELVPEAVDCVLVHDLEMDALARVRLTLVAVSVGERVSERPEWLPEALRDEDLDALQLSVSDGVSVGERRVADGVRTTPPARHTQHETSAKMTAKTASGTSAFITDR